MKPPRIHLGVAHLTALELPPMALVREAARAGFDSVGLRMHPAVEGGAAYPSRPGTRAHEKLRGALRDEGVAVGEVEFIQLTPEVDPAGFARLLEAGADLGAAAVTVSGDDPDPGRLAAGFAALCDLAAPLGLRVDLEFMRWRVVGTLAQAVAVVGAAGRPNGAVLVDALHLHRAGDGAGQVAALQPGTVRAAQLCDAAAEAPRTDEDAAREAREGRLAPGTGSLDLPALLRALPADTALSVEMPMPALEAVPRLALAYRAAYRVVDAVLGSRQEQVTGCAARRPAPANAGPPGRD